MSSAGPASSSPTADTTRGANVHTSRQQEPSAAADARGTTLVDDIVEVSRSWANRLVPTAETWYRLNMTLGLKRLQELIQVGTLLEALLTGGLTGRGGARTC